MTSTDVHEDHEDQGTGLAAGRHDLNIAHLVMGLAFLGIALVWLLGETGVVGDTDLRLLLPVPFLLAGGLGLAAAVLAGRRGR